MSIRFTSFTGAAALAAAALPFVGCFDTDQTCEDLANCADGRAGSGASGAAAGSGAGGSTGTGGGTTGGTSNSGGRGGQGGSAGESGEGGASAGEAGDGGEAGIGGAGSGNAPCDATKTPGEDACVVDEDYGVFVSAAGDDEQGNGSRSRPFATLAKAIDEAIGSQRRVYACADAGHYQESLTLGKAAGGLEIYGGFACDDWSYSTTTQSRLSSKSPLALVIEKVGDLRVEDFRIEAADAADPGESSVGAFVVSSTDVVFRRVSVNAGIGKAGANGTREDFDFPARAELDGNSTTDESGADEKVCECPGDTTTSGGLGGHASLSGQSGGSGTPDVAGPGGEGGTAGLTCGSGGTGQDGAAGAATPPAPGASETGTLTSTGWTPASGTDGTTGSPGQGGGGGTSSSTGGGGGGGCGGCGGAGGKAGKGGGASIALLLFESTVTLEEVDLIAVDAGKGGNGVAGQVGQMEAGGGGDGNGAGACDGGGGGFGADGGASGGGAGGISAGIVWKGDVEPAQTKVTITTGTPGPKGVGGKPGVNDGIAGDAQDVMKAP